MAFSLGCFACCGCDPCTAECDATPDANFETVYQANDNDGTLQWTGDAMGPIDGPYPGFEGSGPFSQTITLAEDFSVTMPGARFPCYARVKFWRNVGGGEGSETVTSSVTINCTAGRVNIGPVVLSEGESAYFGPDPGSSTATYGFETDDAIPLVSGGDDKSASPPASWFGVTAECSPSSISVTATITWSNAAIQHNLYGAFVECYDAPEECVFFCDPDPIAPPSSLFLTITNAVLTYESGYSGPDMDINGEYILSPVDPLIFGCNVWVFRSDTSQFMMYGHVGSDGFWSGAAIFFSVSGVLWTFGGNASAVDPAGGGALLADMAVVSAVVCGGTEETGSETVSLRGDIQGVGLNFQFGSITFDWELST